jgi:hypothetical protein
MTTRSNTARHNIGRHNTEHAAAVCYNLYNQPPPTRFESAHGAGSCRRGSPGWPACRCRTCCAAGREGPLQAGLIARP